MIQVEGLSKRFSDLKAVDRMSFDVRPGEIYGLLGPNGAGKTTALSMIAGLLAPDEGRVVIDGIDLARDPIAVKARLGVVPQEVALYEELSARENLRFWGGLYGLRGARLAQAVDDSLERVGLAPRANDRVRTFSGGMKRRLNLSLGLIHAPRALLLDEPTVGIDPQARAAILDLVRTIAVTGTAVLYTTHYLDEAETLCHRIGIIDHGRRLAEGTLDELKQLHGEGELITVQGAFDAGTARGWVAGDATIEVVSAETGTLVLAAKDGAAARVLAKLLDGRRPIDGVSIRPPSLNGLFLKLTGRELRD